VKAYVVRKRHIAIVDCQIVQQLVGLEELAKWLSELLMASEWNTFNRTTSPIHGQGREDF